jgi:hypothetical protein
LDTVQAHLEPGYAAWETLENPLDEAFLNVILQWAWEHGNLLDDVRAAYRLEPQADLETVRPGFFGTVKLWLAGRSFAEISQATGTNIDDVLAIQARAVGFSLQTAVEQAIALLSKLLESQGRILSSAVQSFPDYLRFGVPTEGACALCRAGLRHRRAAILLGETPEVRGSALEDFEALYTTVARLIQANHAAWEARLGALVLERTLLDLGR